MLSLLAQVCNWAALRLAKELSFGSTHMRERWDILSGATSWVFYGILWQTPMADPPVASNMPEIRSIVVNCFHMFPSWIFYMHVHAWPLWHFPCPELPNPEPITRWCSKVYRIVWWMGLYKHPSPKRHKAFTNNKFCERYNLGRLKMHEFLKLQDPTKKTAVKYQDGQGRTRYKGNGKALKNSQILSLYMSISFPLPLKTIQEIPTFVLQLIG